jgi:hypothetical protein
MSITYLAQLLQFLVVFGLISQSEADVINEGIVAIISLVVLAIGLYGRFRAGGVNIFGLRKK